MLGAAADDHRRAEQRGTAHEPLGGADQLHPPARVDAVGPRAVLARHLADAGVDAEAAQRARQPLPLGREAVMGAGGGIVQRPHDVDPDRVRVVGGRVAAGEPQDGLVAVVAGGLDRRVVAGAERSSLPNATVARGRYTRSVDGSSPLDTRVSRAWEIANSRAAEPPGRAIPEMLAARQPASPRQARSLGDRCADPRRRVRR